MEHVAVTVTAVIDPADAMLTAEHYKVDPQPAGP